MRHANIGIFVPHIGCPNRCSFCDQGSISGANSPPTAADVTEACNVAVKNLGADGKNCEVAFFGGSFTAIEHSYMLELLQAAYPFVKSGQLSGIRLSTRPDAIDEATLETLKCYGVTSIELGAQSMDDAVLQHAKRGHSAAAVRTAASLIKSHGFCLGLQMMLGLPLDTPKKARKTAEEFAALGADEVRIYPTVVIKNTDLAAEFLAGNYTPMTLSEGVPLAAELMQFFVANGIRVIRVGLHASAQLEGDMLAGCYHPAFKELCESEIFMEIILKNAQGLLGKIRAEVHPQDFSKAVGQRRKNVQTLLGHGLDCAFVQNSAVPRGTVRVSQL